MHWVARTTAVLTMIVVIFHGALPAAAAEAMIQGSVEIPCDPSRLKNVASVEIRPVSGGAAVTVDVDPSSGGFRVNRLSEGEYDFVAIGTDGKLVAPQVTRLGLQAGANRVVLSIQPAGCVLRDADADGVSDTMDFCPNSPAGAVVGTDGCPPSGAKAYDEGGLKNWHTSLIYVGIAGAVSLILTSDTEDPASPF